ALLICSFLIFAGCQTQEAGSENDNSIVSESVSSNVFSVDETNTSDTDKAVNVASDKTSESENDLSASKSTSSKESNSSSQSQTTESDITWDTSEYEVSAVEIESQLSGYEEELAGHWDAKYILDASGNEVDGSVIYGQVYKQYGGEMNYDSDGKFWTRMGASANEENEKGTFTYNGGDEIELLYSNDTTVICTRCQVNGEDAIAMPIDLFGDTFTVYFMR
ncbi:MAG: hypothetical protein K2M82_04315, partial [Lachnospiraceae bacterium]|nr:hypothetical protein [Lachnospiraceae bacterium]